MSENILSIGMKAPSFALPDKNGNIISLKDLAGKWVVIYFYPKDLTPGCTIEAHDFTSLLPSFTELNAMVFGVSPDSGESHCRFTDSENLKVTLLSDPDKKVMKQYNAWGMKQMYGKTSEGVIRSTVIIGTDGSIAHLWKKVTADGHADAVLKKLKLLQNG